MPPSTICERPRSWSCPAASATGAGSSARTPTPTGSSPCTRAARYTTSVCTGSLLLAAAGLLDGVDATTHWAARDALAELGANPVAERVVERGKVITAAGVSSGIDMALRLVELLLGETAAQAVQLAIEYDPDPPHDTGSLEKAPDQLVGLVRRTMEAQDAQVAARLGIG